MCYQNGTESKLNAADDKEQHQRDTHDDLTVQHRNIGDAHENRPALFRHAVDADARKRSKHSRNRRGKKRDDQCRIQRIHDLCIGKQ